MMHARPSLALPLTTLAVFASLGSLAEFATAQTFRVPITPASLLSDLTLPNETLRTQRVLSVSPAGDVLTFIEPTGVGSVRRLLLVRDGQAPQVLLQVGAGVPNRPGIVVSAINSGSFGAVDSATNQHVARVWVVTRTTQGASTGLELLEWNGAQWRSLFQEFSAVPGDALAGAAFTSVPSWANGRGNFVGLRAQIGGPGITGTNRDVYATLDAAGTLRVVAQTSQAVSPVQQGGVLRTLNEFLSTIDNSGVVATLGGVSFGETLESAVLTISAQGVLRAPLRSGALPFSLPVGSTLSGFGRPQLFGAAGQEFFTVSAQSQRPFGDGTMTEFVSLVRGAIDGSGELTQPLFAGQAVGSEGFVLRTVQAYATVQVGSGSAPTGPLPAGSLIASVGLSRANPSASRSALLLARPGQAPEIVLATQASVEGRSVESIESSLLVNDAGDVLFMARLGGDRAASILSWSAEAGVSLLVTPPTFQNSQTFVAPRLVGATRDGRFAIATTPVFDYPVLGDPADVWLIRTPGLCSDIDFNNDGSFPSDDDLVAYLRTLAGETCDACDSIDFNNDGITPSDDDLLAFLRVLAGGTCRE
jgi:hypothetical protein